MAIDVSKGFEVGPFHYEVKSDFETEKQLEAGQVYGKCDNLNRVVRLTQNYSLEQFTNTFLHECIEAVNSIYCNNKVKHEEITNLGNGLAQIMKSLGVQFVHNGSEDGAKEKFG